MDRELKKAFLMHKDHIVAEITLDSSGNLARLRKNAAEIEHIPLGGQMNDIKFYEWWKDRAIPKTRQGAVTALERLGYSSTNNMLVDNLALSLTDCYWIRPLGADIGWKDVNLFNNPFEDVFGKLTFNPDDRFDLRDKTSFIPASSQGEVQKKWCIDTDGTRFLVKGNYGDNYQQSINEVFASQLHKTQGYDNAVQYSLTEIALSDERTGLGCSCNSFCSENVESISAWEVLQTRKIRQNESLYYPLREECVRLGIKAEDFDNFISYEIMTDYLLSNTDRHMNNISILRNPDTLQIIGMAPIYDTGNSMFFRDSMNDLKKAMSPIQTHSFIKDEKSLLKYVTDRNLVDLNKLSHIDFSIYKHDTEERHSRIPFIKQRFEQKSYDLDVFQKGKDIWKSDRFYSPVTGITQPASDKTKKIEDTSHQYDVNGTTAPSFIALCGIPGSGKSDKANELNQSISNSEIVSLSKISANYIFLYEEWNKYDVLDTVKNKIHDAFNHGKTVIYDASNILPEHRTQCLSFTKSYDIDKKVLIIMDVDVKSAFINCTENGKNITIDKIQDLSDRLYSSYPSKDEGWDEIQIIHVPKKELSHSLSRNVREDDEPSIIR